jgi:hypothetical protein
VGGMGCFPLSGIRFRRADLVATSCLSTMENPSKQKQEQKQKQNMNVIRLLPQIFMNMALEIPAGFKV